MELARRLQDACLSRGIAVAAAESCTGGLVAHAITEVRGSSGYFAGGVVAYADATKRDVLGVPAAMLEAHGAVSAQVAVAMAEGVRTRLGTTIAVAVTGVAGPGGGTDAKPVGLVYVAVAGAGSPEVRRYQWAGDRTANKHASAMAALELLLARAEGVAP